jgi:hypothetical protein
MAGLRSLMLLLLVSACNNESTSSKQNPAPDTGSDAARVQCPSESGVVSELPSGACEGTGSCALEVRGECGPGIRAIPATPTGYVCQCSSATWTCTIVSGGYGLIPCPDAGT